MRKAKEVVGRKCPFCGKTERQVNAGKNRSGTKGAFAMTAKNTTHLTRRHESILKRSDSKQ